MDALTGREFEELVATVLESFGWQVSLTQQTRDGGYDMLAIQTEAPGLEVSWIIECKKYSKDRRVPVEVVRGLYGVRDYLSIANAAIVTTAGFTHDALTFAKNRTAIKLIDRSTFLAWLSKATLTVPSKSPPKRFESLFLSYSTKDKEFTEKLHARMRDAGMHVWFAPEDVKAGDYLFEQVDRAIQLHDRLLLVLSKDSIQSKWVEWEIRKAHKVERAEKRRKLFPIRLVDMKTLREWECLDSDTGEDLAEEVRKYHIPDFSNWKNHDDFEKAFVRLEKDLRTSISK